MFIWRKHKSIYRTLFLLGILLGIFTFMIIDQADEKELQSQEQGEQEIAQEVNLPLEKKVVMITHFVVGPDQVETEHETVYSLEDLTEKYAEWTLVEETTDGIVFERTVEDIAPGCKNGAYFGLNEEGYLTLYLEEPKEEDDETIETFFQIDIQSLESGLPQESMEQLYQGIPIQDLAEFNSVLSTYSEFALD